MKAKLTALTMKVSEGGYWSVCPEIPGANGQGETVEESKESLAHAVELIMEDRLEEALKVVSKDAVIVPLYISINPDAGH